MPVSNIDSRLMSFGELFIGSNYYAVPNFQRDFSWTETQIDELWNDITNTINENRQEHFMGAMVVKNSNKPKLRLIDGQQRMTTISLLMCVVRDVAIEKGDQELSIYISEKYLGSRNLRTRKTDPKLILNEVNNQFYQENFLEPKGIKILKELKNKLRKKGYKSQNKSNKLMVNAYIKLHSNIQDYLSNARDISESLIEIEECVKDKLISILISVANEANSYLIFETLNNRGLDLSVADLLKNHLFAKASSRLEDVQKKWIEINREVDKFEVTKFIRHYWLSNYKLISEKDLFREISAKFRTSSDVLNFVNSLRESAEIYSAFKNPQSPVWNSFNSNTKNYINQLVLFQTNQCYPALLAAKENLSDELFSKTLQMIVVFSFRYNTICGLNPNKLEGVYSEIAKYIRKESPKSAKSIFEKLSKLYPKDPDFHKAFQKKTVSANNSKLARYILSEINRHYLKSKELIANPNEMELNLEHILPKKPNNNWLEKFSRNDPSQYIYRLGNMTLLDSSVNSKLGNRSFQEKSEAFAHSKLEITKEVADYSVWSPKQIEQRQEKMSKAACQIWRLNY